MKYKRGILTGGGGTDRRDLDEVWKNIDNIPVALNGIVGTNFGDVENNIFYIQDSGVKKKDYSYLDKNNGRLYLCTNETSLTNNTIDNFIEINNVNRSNIVVNNKAYQNNQTIPNWSKYRFHSAKLVVSNLQNAVSDLQIILFGNDEIYYNNNDQRIGAFSARIYNNGDVSIYCNDNKGITNSYFIEIRMWN